MFTLVESKPKIEITNDQLVMSEVMLVLHN